MLAGGAPYSIGNGEPDTSLILSQDYVRIIGEVGSAPVINGTGAGNWVYGIEISGSNVTIDNLHVTGFDDAYDIGISVSSGSGNTIENCEVYGNYDALSIYQSHICTVSGCKIYNNANDGISIGESVDSVISENTIHDNTGDYSDGIIIDGCSPRIIRNTLFDNTFQISVAGYGTDTVFAHYPE